MAQVVGAGKFVAPAQQRGAPRGENADADGRGAGDTANADGAAARGRGGRGGPVVNAYANGPAFCRVAATLTPTSDSEIKIEVWMPAENWNGKLQSVGNGAWAGTISYPAMATALGAGYATASTDTGHEGNNPNFIPDHPEKVVDFAYRAVHGPGRHRHRQS